MLNYERFQEQMNVMGTLFMREISREILNVYWKEFKAKEQTTWDKSMDEIMREEERFPTIHTIGKYYDMGIFLKDRQEWPMMEDLGKQAKSHRARSCFQLIRDLNKPKDKNPATIEDPRFQKVLEWHKEDVKPGKCDLLFTGYDSKRKIFTKVGRMP